MNEEVGKYDAVNHPSHYTAGKVECIDALEAATVNLTGIEAVCTANAIKYLWRWKQKNGVEDLEKAVWYINHLIGEKVSPIEQAIRDFAPSEIEKVGYDALIAWVESTTNFKV